MDWIDAGLLAVVTGIMGFILFDIVAHIKKKI